MFDSGLINKSSVECESKDISEFNIFCYVFSKASK